MAGCAVKLLMVAVVVMLGAMASVTEGQAECASKLTPCFPYINNATAKPTSDCCNPMKDAVAHDLPCLCNLYKDPTLFASLNISLANALRLSRECGVTTDLSACSSTAASPTSAPSPPAGVPGGDNGGDRVALTGITTFLLFLVSMLMY